jgi:hypothetical protein
MNSKNNQETSNNPPKKINLNFQIKLTFNNNSGEELTPENIKIDVNNASINQPSEISFSNLNIGGDRDDYTSTNFDPNSKTEASTSKLNQRATKINDSDESESICSGQDTDGDSMSEHSIPNYSLVKKNLEEEKKLDESKENVELIN